MRLLAWAKQVCDAVEVFVFWEFIRSFVLKSYSVIVMFVFAEKKHLIITHTLLFCNMTAIESFSSENIGRRLGFCSS